MKDKFLIIQLIEHVRSQKKKYIETLIKDKFKILFRLISGSSCLVPSLSF